MQILSLQWARCRNTCICSWYPLPARPFLRAFPRATFRKHSGFPVFEASVAYPVSGCRAVMGWVQLVTVTDTKTGVVETSVDQLPFFRDLEVPFMALGARGRRSMIRAPTRRAPTRRGRR
jgi:hypothetical protein